MTTPFKLYSLSYEEAKENFYEDVVRLDSSSVKPSSNTSFSQKEKRKRIRSKFLSGLEKRFFWFIEWICD